MYFVTICTRNRECLFGLLTYDEVRLNDSGHLASVAWKELPSRFPTVSLDSFVVMPNHIHGIIIVGAQFIAPNSTQFIAPDSVPRNQIGNSQDDAINRAPTLGEIVRTYKAASTRMIRQTANLEFAWQRNYYEHVVRNEESLYRIRQYILENPARWAMDWENPDNSNPEPENPWEGKVGSSLR